MNTAVPVRGIRRFELLTASPEASVEFHAALHDWVLLSRDGGVQSCWVGDRLAATIRFPEHGESLGWRVIFGTGPQAEEPSASQHPSAVVEPGRVAHGPWAPAPRSGEPCWAELAAASADERWTSAVGWEMAEGAYTLEGRAVSGRRPVPETSPEAGEWTCCLATDDLSRTLDRVRDLGGTVLGEDPTNPLGRAVTVADPDGARYALVEQPGGWGGALAT
ncbi:VOC family protein [Actinoalloteichus caeruleus]|uniref:VOC family protein n=1 Tax=Actinoalloteichus cyanogriseus TaxID=2893586 RepID=UPI003BB9719F